MLRAPSVSYVFSLDRRASVNQLGPLTSKVTLRGPGHHSSEPFQVILPPNGHSVTPVSGRSIGLLKPRSSLHSKWTADDDSASRPVLGSHSYRIGRVTYSLLSRYPRVQDLSAYQPTLPSTLVHTQPLLLLPTLASACSSLEATRRHTLWQLFWFGLYVLAEPC